MDSNSKKPRLRYRAVIPSSGQEAILEPVNHDEIVWTTWCQGGIVLHIVPIYCGQRTKCGTRMFTRRGWWKTAWGIPEDMKDRMCLSCMRSYARDISPDRRIPPWSTRNSIHHAQDVQ